jgi:hypothetical protein
MQQEQVNRYLTVPVADIFKEYLNAICIKKHIKCLLWVAKPGI